LLARRRGKGGKAKRDRSGGAHISRSNSPSPTPVILPIAATAVPGQLSAEIEGRRSDQ